MYGSAIWTGGRVKTEWFVHGGSATNPLVTTIGDIPKKHDVLYLTDVKGNMNKYLVDNVVLVTDVTQKPHPPNAQYVTGEYRIDYVQWYRAELFLQPK